jgi:hypothetical protein
MMRRCCYPQRYTRRYILDMTLYGMATLTNPVDDIPMYIDSMQAEMASSPMPRPIQPGGFNREASLVAPKAVSRTGQHMQPSWV